MPARYEIDIAMSLETVTTLKNGDFALYAFKAVRATISGGAPLIWFKTTNFMTASQVIWQQAYQAYISWDQIIPNGKVTAIAACDLDLGQTAEVSERGDMNRAPSGAPGALSIMNRGQVQWTAGISQLIADRPAQVCAVPLYGAYLGVIAPVEKVLVMFAPNIVDTGTVSYKAYAPGLLVDLTDSPTRATAFDIDNGWSWDGGPWAQRVQLNDDLVPLLFSQS